jgi:hypothetical protein
MEIKPVGVPQQPSEKLQPVVPKKDMYDIDIDIKDKVDQLVREHVPSRGCGVTNTCPTPCGTCGCGPSPW